jgi:hypothetical protein
MCEFIKVVLLIDDILAVMIELSLVRSFLQAETILSSLKMRLVEVAFPELANAS